MADGRFGIADHPQIPWVRCPKCEARVIGAENQRAVRIPPHFKVRAGREPSKSPYIKSCPACGAEINKRAHHQAVPCAGDRVAFAVDPRDPGGRTLTGVVRKIREDNSQGVPTGVEVVADDGTEFEIDLFSARLMKCVNSKRSQVR